MLAKNSPQAGLVWRSFVFVTVCCFLAMPATAARKASTEVTKAKANGQGFQTRTLLHKGIDQTSEKRMDMRDLTNLDLDIKAVERLRAERPQTLALNLPRGEAVLSLELVQVNVVSDDFFVETSDSNGEAVAYEPGVYYRGIVKGREDTLAAVSVFENEVMGIINTPEDGELVLGRARDAMADEHVLYAARNMKADVPFTCETEEPEGFSINTVDLEAAPQSFAAKCIRVYFEADYKLYQEQGSTSATVNYITGMYNVVAAIYANENISTVVGQTFVWTSQDNYSTTSASSALNSFMNRNHNQDLGHLIARGGNNLGGVAWLNGLCDNTYGYAYSNINASYSNLPTYSWTVGVVTHEMGHNLGSPHTHSCSWQGGALDNCYTPEGSCSRGPAPPSSGGTIMSYCHLTNIGIDLSAGFGTQPGNLIRNNVNNASCLGSCDTDPTGSCGDELLTGNSGSFSDGSGSSNYDNNRDCRWRIDAGSGAVTLSFDSFNTEANYDFVTVYDNHAGTGTPLGRFSGSSIPADVTSQTGKLLVTFSSDQYVTAPGFSASWSKSTTTCKTLDIEIVLDNYGSETRWEVVNSSGQVVGSGGTYSNGTNGQVVSERLCLPAGCYTFKIYDSYGDGICCGYGRGGYTLKNGSGQTLASGGQFGSQESKQICL